MKLDWKDSTYVRAFALPVLSRLLGLDADEDGPDDCPALLFEVGNLFPVSNGFD